MEKKIKGKYDSKKQHCKLEVIFTAFHYSATNRSKLNNKMKGLRQTRIFLSDNFQDYVNVLSVH